MYASNKQGDETPLMPASASGSGHTEVVKLLLDKGADVNVRSKVCGEPCILHVYYYRTYEKAVSGGGEREKGGHVLRDTTSRGLYVRVCIALVKRYSRGRYSRYRKRKKRNFKNLNVTLKIYAVERKNSKQRLRLSNHARAGARGSCLLRRGLFLRGFLCSVFLTPI